MYYYALALIALDVIEGEVVDNQLSFIIQSIVKTSFGDSLSTVFHRKWNHVGQFQQYSTELEPQLHLKKVRWSEINIKNLI
ncbi:unnamed protein product [Acanthoscelides obtectus]|uniref:Uncharacterized protein n=1 Tax=Acanthoscelides obtectus TaxID=200917 RepID=A0A9P0NVX4_ACAOB|nr:unnamed protein product [Acanthoscelides obtectus]CAH1966652.1 unnamed protein product [Acanthoscelides obtectus]CAH1989985.1 unnamed protein product [Acanthoscelides obtectus]CAH2010659.1 unnamed protein product [Acanthoscelides obtectus]CAK1626672.1 hypothetical protein AOBTE_LOCUS4022 [Acanthoscelides obtectus]